MRVKKYTAADYKGEFNLLLMEKKHIVRVSNMCNHKKDTTALILGISERRLYDKIKLHNIKRETTYRAK